MGILKKIFNNTGKPEGFLGKLMLASMNTGHGAVSDWGMNCLPEIKLSVIAELGCGGGRNDAELLNRYPTATLTALDYSPLAVEKAKEYNKSAIDTGRCDVVQGNVCSLLFADHVLDLATAFETVYFWWGLADYLRQAGFAEITVHRNEKKHWLCLVAGKKITRGKRAQSQN